MKKEIVNKLMNSVVGCDVEDAAKTAEEALKAGVESVETIEDGPAEGIRVVGDRFGAGEPTNYLMELERS
ncbi:hypothetical protein GWO13_05220 [Candidatus Bathyarchaeota archaeon]|nr:hypothetical protein [Candidatus Bathyarchaeota archaeon]